MTSAVPPSVPPSGTADEPERPRPGPSDGSGAGRPIQGQPTRLARLSVRNVAISMGVLLVPLVAVVLVVQQVGEPVVTTDPGPSINSARAVADYPVREPAGLPETWRVSSATTATPAATQGGTVVLRLGFVAPSGGAVLLVQSDEPAEVVLAREVGTGFALGGTVRVGAWEWQRRPGRSRGEQALVLLEEQVTIVVTGQASIDELTTLAAALR